MGPVEDLAKNLRKPGWVSWYTLKHGALSHWVAFVGSERVFLLWNLWHSLFLLLLARAGLMSYWVTCEPWRGALGPATRLWKWYSLNPAAIESPWELECPWGCRVQWVWVTRVNAAPGCIHFKTPSLNSSEKNLSPHVDFWYTVHRAQAE